FASQCLPPLERARVVFGQDVSRHLEPHADWWCVPLGHGFERGGVIGRSVPEHDVYVNGGDEAGVGNLDVVDRRGGCTQRRERPAERLLHLWIQQIAEILSRDAEAKVTDR